MKIAFRLYICLFLIQNIGAVDLINKDTIQKIYQLMKDMHDVFTFHKIEYWIEGSTLLGATRYNGLLPWIDNLDVCIDKKHEKKLITMTPTLDLLGYKVLKTAFGYRAFPNDGFSIEDNEKPWKYPYFDIFLVTKHKDKIYYPMYVQNSPRRDKGRPFVKIDELFPLTKYLFGPIIVMGPNNPFKYLEIWYGSSWYATINKTLEIHRSNKIESILQNSQIDEIKAVLPSSPIVNRFNVPILKEVQIDYASRTLVAN